MSNPYKPPASEVILTRSESEDPKRFWKVFFWFSFFIKILSLTIMLSGSNVYLSSLASDSLIYFVVFSGLFGYSYDLKILKPIFWRAAIPMGISYDIYSTANYEWHILSTDDALYFTVGCFVFIVLPMCIFQYVALYYYGEKSSIIWSKSSV